MNVYYVAAAWMGLALLASLISIRLGISIALVEIVVGALAGNLPVTSAWLQQTEFTSFLAMLGSVVLTFLAGAEIDPVSLRRHWRASLSIGAVSFAAPALLAFAVCRGVLGWNLEASEVGALAMSTTSVAVVYAVLLETGLSRQEVGQLILAACFVTGLGTVVFLGALFASYGLMLLVFCVTCVITLGLLPRLTRLLMTRAGHRVSEPEVKFLLMVLLGLGGLASAAGSEAVLPAYVAGLVVAGLFVSDRVVIDRVRSIAFALLTPFFFLRAGLLVSAPALVPGAGAILILFSAKMLGKVAGVWPVSRAFGVLPRERNFTTLLMATGLTFGSIASLFGLSHHLISEAQYSELVATVILSAVLPTILAQRLFTPQLIDVEEEEALGAEDMSLMHPRG
ncbi:MAG: cation:proton antiporter [Candidatus Dormibacteria bacterium]